MQAGGSVDESRFIEYKGCLNSMMSNFSNGGITDRDVTRRTLNFVYML